METPKQAPEALSPAQRALYAVKDLKAKLAAAESASKEPIAIVGMACRFPGGVSNPTEFWNLLQSGVDAVTEVPRERWDVNAYYDPTPATPGKMYTRYGAFLKDVDQFDPHLFGIAPREAVSLDPQHRLLLEVSWEALEDAGYAPDAPSTTPTGIFVGIGVNEYAQLSMSASDVTRIDPYLTMGSTPSAAAGRISYVLGLQGPSMVVDTACSSSIVAVHLACASLRARDCGTALAGAVNLILSPNSTIALSSLRMMAPDGRCKTFDASADGFVRGEGCGMVVLKRLTAALKDGDGIYAVIRGSSVNQDGRSGGFTAPNGLAQQTLLRRALANAGVDASLVGYVEAHGTGTALGDPIELQALSAVMCEGRSTSRPLMVGSVKTNVGHLEAAAGMAGLIKTILALRHHEIPPHLHLNTPNPHIPWKDLCIAVPLQSARWDSEGIPRIAGVSSFGATGTNAHVILEEAPTPANRPQGVDRPLHVLTLSGKDEAALSARRRDMDRFLPAGDSTSFADLCFTANHGRSHFAHRIAVVAASLDEARGKLARSVATEATASPKVAFLFSGQGSQYAGMTRALYDTNALFRDTIDQAARIVGGQFLNAMFGDNSDLLDRTEFTQPCLFALEYGLARMWRAWGIEPAIVMGHSVGEYAAAAVAGLFSFEDGLRLAAERGRLMQQLPDGGAMLAVLASESEVVTRLRPGVCVAALNGVENVVISGEAGAIAEARDIFERCGRHCEPLRVSHAFHSALMDPVLPALRDAASRVEFDKCNLPLISNLTGRIASDEELSSPDYWVRHARGTVRFRQSIETVREHSCDAYIEIGPHPVLLGMAGSELGDHPLCLPSLRRGRGDWEQMLDSLAALYLKGALIDWKALDAGYSRRKVSLPAYPFQRQRYWLPTAAQPARPPAQPGAHPLLGRLLRSPEIQGVVFEAEWNADWPDLVAAHRLFGRVVTPAAAWIEMASTACRRLFPRGGVQMENVALHEPLVLGQQAWVTVQTIVNLLEDGSARFRIVSLQGDEWVCHASGSVRAAESASVPRISAPIIDLDAAPHYAAMRQRGVELGASFQWIERLRLDAGEAWGVIRAARLDDRTDQYGIHPGLIDSCLQMLGAAAGAAQIGDSVFVPVAIDGIRLPEGVAAVARCFARVRESGNNTLTGDVRMLDVSGDEVGVLTGVQLRRMGRSSLHQTTADLLYEIIWKPVEGQAAPVEDDDDQWVIYADQGDLGAALCGELSKRGQRVVLVSGTQHGISGRVIYLRALDGEPCARLLPVIQAPLSRLTVVTRAGSLDQAAFHGLANTFAFEHPGVKCCWIEIESNDAATLADSLLRNDEEERIAIRDGVRYAARLRRFRTGEGARPRIRPDGTYLITGGMGALGLETAQWLWNCGARNIALMGRSVHSDDERFRRFAGDVSRREDVDTVLREIAASMPSLAGVVHAAGVLDDGLLVHQTPNRFDRVMAPKAGGAWNLHEATKTLPLDFFILYSSVASILGSAGQANYAAANSYLDALARHRHSAGLPALSINWGPWAGSGMAARTATERRFESVGFKPIEPTAAFRALEIALTGGCPVVAIFEADWARAQHAGTFLSELLPGSAEVKFLPTLRATAPAQQAGLLRDHVRAIAARVLGRDTARSIADTDKFFDLGLDSLMALEMRNLLQAALKCSLPSTLTFEYPTVSALTGYLMELLDLGPGKTPAVPAAQDSVLTMIEHISEDEAEVRLHEKLRALEELEILH
jgi:acyl transferase domain-containing protein/acyl carrier protein